MTFDQNYDPSVFEPIEVIKNKEMDANYRTQQIK